jgi:hypothetical protein
MEKKLGVLNEVQLNCVHLKCCVHILTSTRR